MVPGMAETSIARNLRLALRDLRRAEKALLEFDFPNAARDDQREWITYLLVNLRTKLDELDARLKGNDPLMNDHSARFRQVSTLYPRRVAEAYGGDIAAAAQDGDVTVAQRVRNWEIDQGIEPMDWIAIGREERAE